MAETLTYAERLDIERHRDGKPPLTPEERLAKLIRIRDGALICVEKCVATGVFKGSASATDMYVFARDEIKADTSAGARDAAADIAAFPGFDPSLIVGNGTGDRIEA